MQTNAKIVYLYTYKKVPILYLLPASNLSNKLIMHLGNSEKEIYLYKGEKKKKVIKHTLKYLYEA